MLLAAIIESTNNNRGQHLAFLKPTPGISEALELLNFLAGYNNQAARARRDQIQRLHDHIPALVETLHAGVGTGNGNAQSPFGSSTSPLITTPHSTGAHPLSYINTSNFESGGDILEGYTSASLPMPFPSDAQTMYSLYQGDDFVLTGADVADFEELQRHLLGCDIPF
jgi:proline utilization trans-activator